MAIIEVSSAKVIQICAGCSIENHVEFAELRVGGARETPMNARFIPLPECPQCQSTEFLIRSPDDEPEHPAPGTFGHLHRMLVDHLHAELVDANKVHPALRDAEGCPKQNLARRVPKAHRDRWFPRGMRIETEHREQRERMHEAGPTVAPDKGDP